MVEITGLTFAYGEGQPVFSGFSWRVRAGEAWAIIGPSGCGKSTLLYLIAGLRQPKGGTILVDGSPVPRPRASTGLVLQDYGLLPWATVWENVALPMRLGRFYRKKGDGEGGDPALSPPGHHARPCGLTGWSAWGSPTSARSTRASSAAASASASPSRRSLLQQPNLLLMDEPFSSLDAVTREDLQGLTAELAAETAGDNARRDPHDRGSCLPGPSHPCSRPAPQRSPTRRRESRGR